MMKMLGQIAYTGNFKLVLVSPRIFFKELVDKMIRAYKGEEVSDDGDEEKLYMGGFPTYLKEEQIK